MKEIREERGNKCHKLRLIDTRARGDKVNIWVATEKQVARKKEIREERVDRLLKKTPKMGDGVRWGGGRVVSARVAREMEIGLK